jgi:hypothetical protein
VKDAAINDFARSFLSVIAGVLAAIAVGALLIPVVQQLLERFFNLYLFTKPPADAWKDDLMVEMILFGWFFIASLAGGFVCTIISTNKDTIHVLISSLVSLVLIVSLSGGDLFKENQYLSSILIVLGIPLGNLFGGWMGSRFKRKRSARIS